MGDQIIMFISQIFNGLKIGSVYSLVALGYTMVYGIIRLINFAHGDFIMVGAYVLMLTIPAIVAFGLPAWVAVIPAILMCVAVGVIVERAAYKPVREKGNSMTALITAIAMSLLLENGSQAIFGADYQTVPTIIQIPTLAIGKLKIDGATIITIVLGVIIMVALQLFVTYTKQGKAMRAVSEDKEASILMGINVNSTITLTFAIGSGLAAVASLMYCVSYPQVSPMMGAMLGLKAFVAAVLGQLTLGCCGFEAIGAYSAALLSKLLVANGVAMDPTLRFLLTTLAGGVVACIFGILVGIPALRLHGDYLAIITLGFGEIIRVIIQNLKVAGGMGLDKGAAGQALIGIDRLANLYVVFWITVVTVVLLFMFARSRYGRAVKAIRDDEIAASASGINITYMKVLVFAISAFFAGIAGGIFAQYIGSLNPAMAGWLQSINYVIMVVFGGMGSLTGSIVSAIALTILPELLRAFSTYRMLVYSVALVLIMIFRPQGIFGNWEFSLTKTINKLFYPMKFKAHGKPKQAETVEKVKASKDSGKNAKKTTEKVETAEKIAETVTTTKEAKA